MVQVMAVPNKWKVIAWSDVDQDVGHHTAVLLVDYGISNTIVLEIP